MMTYSINWNYIQSKQQAAHLEEQAERLRAISLGKMDEAILGLSGSWEGENATACLSKAEQLKNDVEEAARNLSKTAAVIRSLAERSYQAEERVREIASIRKK